MRDHIWIFKQDGTKQCNQGQEIPIGEMQKELETAGVEVIDSEKRKHCNYVNTVCGAPTNQVNAYKISRKDWDEFSSGFIGTLGFQIWTCDESSNNEMALTDEDPPFPWGSVLSTLASTSAADKNPIFVRELFGRLCRVYQEGDQLTKDLRPNRVNIALNKSNEIQTIWFG